jgi:DMSO/TMAO reductase YedYZ molybdopterin-dependent catalytic subunit
MSKKSFAVLLLIVIAASVTACNNPGNTPGNQIESTDNLKNLAKVEVKDYNGEHLNSLLDFRENSIKGPQTVDISTYKLKIDGLVENPAEYTYDEVLANTPYTKVVALHCVEGWNVTILWEGIRLKDLFDKAKVDGTANTVIFYGYDGYSTSLPLKTVLDYDMIIAYKMNGVTLPGARGFPFELVAESRLGYKWCKWITRIELSSNSSYRGYWEQRGYTNEANLTD